jgi:hypothetical protein
MGKVKSSSASSRLRQYVSEFKDVIISDDKVLFWQAGGSASLLLQGLLQDLSHLPPFQQIGAKQLCT